MNKQSELEKQKEINKRAKNLLFENLANIFTFFRLFGSIWIFIIAIRNPEQLWRMVIIAILVVLTDLLDGKIARKLEITSPFGAALDQLGDKVFVVPSLIILTLKYRWVVADQSVNLINFTIALIVLLIFIEALLFFSWWVLFIINKIQIHTNIWAKCKTFSIFPIVILWLVSTLIERDFKASVIQYSIYLITLALIITDIFSCLALKAYYQGYFELEKVKEIKEKAKQKSPE